MHSFLLGCSKHSSSSSFVTATLVIEQFSMQPERVEAEVLIRTPRTVVMKQTLLRNPDGSFREFQSATYDPANLDGAPVET